MLSPFPSNFTFFKDCKLTVSSVKCLSQFNLFHITTGEKQIVMGGLTFQEMNVFSEFNKIHPRDGKMQNYM